MSLFFFWQLGPLIAYKYQVLLLIKSEFSMASHQVVHTYIGCRIMNPRHSMAHYILGCSVSVQILTWRKNTMSVNKRAKTINLSLTKGRTHLECEKIGFSFAASYILFYDCNSGPNPVLL